MWIIPYFIAAIKAEGYLTLAVVIACMIAIVLLRFGGGIFIGFIAGAFLYLGGFLDALVIYAGLTMPFFYYGIGAEKSDGKLFKLIFGLNIYPYGLGSLIGITLGFIDTQKFCAEVVCARVNFTSEMISTILEVIERH